MGEKIVDDEGRVYYHNTESGATQWEAPPGFEDDAANDPVVETPAKGVLAIHAYEATDDNQLSVSKGERLVVLDTEHDVAATGWTPVKNSSGAHGYVPASYLSFD